MKTGEKNTGTIAFRFRQVLLYYLVQEDSARFDVCIELYSGRAGGSDLTPLDMGERRHVMGVSHDHSLPETGITERQ